MKSGKQIGDEHLAALELYISNGGALPVSPKDGTLNLTALAKATGISKSSFYQNQNVKDRLEAARLEAGLMRQGERQQKAGPELQTSSTSPVADLNLATAALERRLHRMEQQNAALVAENYELRRLVKDLRLQLGREDMMIETGMRVVAPTTGS